MPKRRVIIVGGGASGLMAATQVAQCGADAMLLERMPRPMRKLAITGKGRCNLTNIAELRDFLDHFGREGRFLRQAFARFFTPDLIAFLDEIGLPTITERGGRIFPASGRAPDVVAALLHRARGAGVHLRTRARVSALQTKAALITGVKLGREELRADAVILATGGAAYPATGSSGDGYRLAEAVGHTVTPIRPALVPLETDEILPTGLTLRNVGVELWIDARKRRAEFGELAFTETGLAGPTALTLSGAAVDGMRAEKRVEIVIDLKPALDEDKLDARLRRELEAHGKRSLRAMLKTLLPAALIPICLDRSGLDPHKVAHQISSAERRRLRSWLKGYRLTIHGHRPWEEAIITAGGVTTREIDPRTMESRRVRGLYFAGEVIDIAADTGGYNLQAAFSTGWLAGRSAAGVDPA